MEKFNSYKDAFISHLRLDEKHVSPEQYKELSVGIDPDGGYTVTPEMSSRIIEKLRESDPIRELATVENISTDALEYLVDYGEMGAGWEGETESGDKTDTAELKKKRIPVHIMYAKPRATQQLLEDSSINIEQWISRKIAEKFSRLEGAAFVEGDGIGKPRGFLTYANGTSWGQVEQINMGAAAALTADGFIKIKYSLQEFYLNTGVWLLNRTALRDAMMLKYGTGEYIWKPSLLSSDPVSTILGSAVRMSTSMPAVAANALSVAYSDWKEAYSIVDRLGITIQRDPYTVKPYVEFYTRKRLGGDVVNFDAIKLGKISA
jgi:HK97 family phage major capsid protein